MAVQSKFLATGKLGHNNWTNARYIEIDRDFYGSSNYYLLTRPNFPLQFKKCSSSRCLTCPKADHTQIVQNDSSKDIKNFCKAFNIIYSIRCNKCNLQYIGETCTALHYRINQHRSNIDNSTDFTNNVEFLHFKLHGFHNITIKILGFHKNINERKLFESQYIKANNSLYPYGLNSNIYNRPHHVFTNITKLELYKNIYVNLNHSVNKKTTRSKRGSKSSSLCNLTRSQVKNDLSGLENEFNNNFNWFELRKYIFAIKKKDINRFFQIFSANTYSTHFSDVLFDLIHYRALLLNIKLTKKPNFKNSDTQLIINFTNPIFNKINLQYVINHDSNFFPIKRINIHKTFKYNMTMGRRIFNYNKFAKNINSNTSTICLCNDPTYSKFVNKDHGHIITGDLNIIENVKLRQLMQFGTKFRIPKKFSHNQILQQFAIDLDLFIYKISIDYNKPVEYFNEWKFNVLNKLKNELIENLQYYKGIFVKDLNSYIENLQNNFIITYVDKSPNNYAVICKFYYAHLINSAFNSSVIFKKTSLTTSKNNLNILLAYKWLKIKSSNFNYPYLVIIPKFHKYPVKFRTVTIGCNTYNNQASNKLLSILTKIYDLTIKRDNLFCIKNSFQLVNKIKDLKNVFHIKTYDFVDLFNNINIKDLFRVMIILFKENCDLLNVSTNITLSYFKRLITFILFQNYIIFNNAIYKQIIGLPQGGKSSSILADLYLYYYERNTCLNNFSLFRYIDDIIVLYYYKTSNYTFPICYPTNLKFCDNNLCNNTINFLDLKIIIDKNKNLSIDLYDKRNDFPFKVNLFTHYNSCLHKTVYVNILLNFAHRIKNICSNDYRYTNLQSIFKLALTYGYPKYLIRSILYN